MPVIQSPETVFLLQLFGKYERSELCGAARHYGIPEPMWPVSLQHGTDHFLPYLTALVALRLGDPLDVHASYQYYQLLYLIIITCRRILNMPMVNKQLSMRAESLSTLLMVHHYGRPTHALTELRRRLRRLRIHPNMYTFTHFSQPNAVHWKQRVELRPDFAVYEVHVHERLRKWCLHHGLPLDQFHAPLMEHLRSQFQQHRQHASTHQLLTKHQLNILHRHLGQDFVCRNEDHDNHHLTFFCPQLYFKGLHNTWLQSGTFAATTLKPDQAEAIILEAIPRHLQQRYTGRRPPPSQLEKSFSNARSNGSRAAPL